MEEFKPPSYLFPKELQNVNYVEHIEQIRNHNFLLFMSDSAAYILSLRWSFKEHIDYLLHVTCTIHVIHE